MASNKNKTVLLVITVVIGLIGLGAAALVALGFIGFLSELPDVPQPEAVSVEMPVVAEPGSGLAPTFVPPEGEDALGLIEDEPDEPASGIDLEAFQKMSAVEIVAAMSFMRLHQASQWDTRVDLPHALTLTSPAQMGSVELTSAQGVYSGVGALTYLVGDFVSPLYTQLEKPAVCNASWGGREDWDYFNERCQNFVYNEMIRLKYGKPLYKDIAELDPETLALILEDLSAIKADTPMLGSAAGEVYVAVAPAVHDYLTVWEALGKRKKAMHARYKKALRKRGALRGGNATRDMIDVYYQLHEEMPDVQGLHDADYTHTIVGFWMRRIDDGTAEQLVAFMKQLEKEHHAKR